MVDRARAYSVFLVICIALALNFWFGIYTAEASPNIMLAGTSNSDAKIQETFREDARLTNSCIEAGQDKAYCLCLTSIYKHRLSPRDYSAAVTLYENEKTAQPETLKAGHTHISTQTHSGLELQRLNAKRQTLTNSAEFENNCREATAFFERVK